MLKPIVQKKIKKIFYTVIVFLLAVCVLLITTTFSDFNVYWYVSLNKPFNPPFWLYVVGWSVNYLLIAISAVIVLSDTETKKKRCPYSLPLYLINAFFISLYSVLFFGLRAINLAFIEAVFMLASIILLICCNYKISKTAAYLIVPYLLSTIYMLFLHAMIIFSN